MAGNSLLVLIDDIATLLDDIAVMSKVAAKKTAGVLGDDLALNAQQVTGVSANRELPVVWAVAKGSFFNKCLLVPAALAISAFAPWLVTPLLILGGLFLCYEGCEKILHMLLHPQENAQHHDDLVAATNDPNTDMLQFEKDKIKGAIRTDFILSAEIIAITLGIVANADFAAQALTLSVVAIAMTVAVYGLVAAIVRLDDWGLYLHQKSGIQSRIGFAILQIVPYLMKSLSIIGTAAMFLVGGGILSHGLQFLHHWVEIASTAVASIAVIGSTLAMVTPVVLDGIFGILAGLLCYLLVDVILKPLLFKK